MIDNQSTRNDTIKHLRMIQFAIIVLSLSILSITIKDNSNYLNLAEEIDTISKSYIYLSARNKELNEHFLDLILNKKIQKLRYVNLNDNETLVYLSSNEIYNNKLKVHQKGFSNSILSLPLEDTDEATIHFKSVNSLNKFISVWDSLVDDLYVLDTSRNINYYHKETKTPIPGFNNTIRKVKETDLRNSNLKEKVKKSITGIKTCGFGLFNITEIFDMWNFKSIDTNSYEGFLENVCSKMPRFPTSNNLHASYIATYDNCPDSLCIKRPAFIMIEVPLIKFPSKSLNVHIADKTEFSRYLNKKFKRAFKSVNRFITEREIGDLSIDNVEKLINYDIVILPLLAGVNRRNFMYH